MAEHSPGPWHVVHEPTLSTFHIRVQDLDAAPVASLFYSSSGARPQLSRELIEANAALIAAAPEMYEACKELLDKAYRVNDRYVAGGSPAGSLGLAIEEMAGMLCKARAALAKAQPRTGGERGEG